VAACVGTTNLVAAGESNGPLDASKRLDRHAAGAALERRLTGEQCYTAHYNRALALLRLNKLDACAELLTQLKRDAPARRPSDHTGALSASSQAATVSNRPQAADMVWLLEAALLYRRGRQAEASALLEEHAASSPHACLGAAQQALSKGRITEAIAQLRRSRPLGHYPAAAAAQARLLDQVGEHEQADAVLADAERYWADEQRQPQRRFVITEGRAVRLLARGEYERATALLGGALKSVDDVQEADVDATLLRRLRCRLALALARCGRGEEADLALAQIGVTGTLSPATSSTSSSAASASCSLDLDALERVLPRPGGRAAASTDVAGPSSSKGGTALPPNALSGGAQAACSTTSSSVTATASSSTSASASSSSSPAPRSWTDGRVFDPVKAAAAKARRRKHRCKTHVPRNYRRKYVHPDPERWLPLRERSYYKHAKGRRRYVQQPAKRGAAQGGAYSEEDAKRLDRSAQPRTTLDKGKGPAHSKPSPARAGGSRNNKKKGGRRRR
jgi:tetratricopeptide (TPR) repeat protein